MGVSIQGRRGNGRTAQGAHHAARARAQRRSGCLVAASTWTFRLDTPPTTPAGRAGGARRTTGDRADGGSGSACTGRDPAALDIGAQRISLDSADCHRPIRAAEAVSAFGSGVSERARSEGRRQHASWYSGSPAVRGRARRVASGARRVVVSRDGGHHRHESHLQRRPGRPGEAGVWPVGTGESWFVVGSSVVDSR